MLSYIILWLRSLGLSEEAQGLAEYALILVLVALAVLVVLGLLGGRIREVFQEIIDGLATPA